jgi:hypothetical protein
LEVDVVSADSWNGISVSISTDDIEFEKVGGIDGSEGTIGGFNDTREEEGSRANNEGDWSGIVGAINAESDVLVGRNVVSLGGVKRNNVDTVDITVDNSVVIRAVLLVESDKDNSVEEVGLSQVVDGLGFNSK